MGTQTTPSMSLLRRIFSQWMSSQTTAPLPPRDLCKTKDHIDT